MSDGRATPCESFRAKHAWLQLFFVLVQQAPRDPTTSGVDSTAGLCASMSTDLLLGRNTPRDLPCVRSVGTGVLQPQLGMAMKTIYQILTHGADVPPSALPTPDCSLHVGNQVVFPFFLADDTTPVYPAMTSAAIATLDALALSCSGSEAPSAGAHTSPTDGGPRPATPCSGR